MTLEIQGRWTTCKDAGRLRRNTWTTPESGTSRGIRGTYAGNTRDVRGEYAGSTRGIRGKDAGRLWEYAGRLREYAGRLWEYAGTSVANNTRDVRWESTRYVRGKYTENTRDVRGKYEGRTRKIRGTYAENTRDVRDPVRPGPVGPVVSCPVQSFPDWFG
ncbi:hypothetical protein Syun_031364 [Stephania yunnanensis]|uniref:Uncharacterized protein n=1 Tax=Stephania yunnanensis TaxID=152371 RepID=A0AAP0HH18_9MAGN